ANFKHIHIWAAAQLLEVLTPIRDVRGAPVCREIGPRTLPQPSPQCRRFGDPEETPEANLRAANRSGGIG
ncbi:MAG TPA: hypothetical protein VGJ04_11305, partial [Pirellulales bacterium]